MIHRSGLEESGYTTSPLVPILIFGMLFMLILVVILTIFLVLLLISRRWRAARATVINLVAVTGLMFAGMYIDAPTIVYMT